LRPVFVNGKFCAQRTTGVQRYAHSLLAALDAQLDASRAVPWTVLLPPDATAPPLRAIAAQRVPWRGPGGLHGWEQIALPRAARGGLLVNLAGSAPAWRRSASLCVLHDAAPFDRPQAHAWAFRTWYRWLFARLARRGATTLVTVSGFSRERLAAALRTPPERWHLIRGGAEHLDSVIGDAAVLAAHGLTGGTYLLAVGSRNPNKNVDRLIQAWRSLGADAPRLVLVGGANARVFAAGRAAPPDPRLLDLGALDDRALKALYEHALALVFPSLYEGFGLPPLEAMACGCPVIASSIPALRETCGDAALYVDPLAPDDIARALRRLIDDPALRADLRARGRARAGELRWRDAARALLDLVEATA
jgi:glycosyltransferase involved in cell wall biosynthesis